MAHSIALLPGDGIGPTVVDAAASLVERAAGSHGVEIEATTYPWGAEHYLETGTVMPEDAIDRLAEHDAVLLGAVGHPEVDNADVARRGHHRIRRELDLWCNLRPAELLADDVSPLAGYGRGDVDILWFRENSEGAYVDAGGVLDRGGAHAPGERTGTQTALFTESGVERIARAAFEAATERDRHVTSVTKSNVLSHGMALWDDVVGAVSAEYPDVELETLFVDAANLRVVTAPERFDVAVAPNLLSDVVTDATAGVVGGLGLAPSANVNPDADVPGMYEPVHGTAPDIAGEGVADPLATVLSGAMLLADLGEEAAAADLRDAVVAQLAAGAPRTPDLGGSATTADVVADLADRL
ncbi:MAG: isocitrate/isopropylmalate dehydrogenase family protein [Haloferacaceae archaeon]